ncbi:MAG: hypothetical protein FWE28_08760 [Oscillospiraceae bacterium]|nr:hypothetical protein [Oscillospiraceae bacterium]
MKDYCEYMDQLSITPEAHANIMVRLKEKPPARTRRGLQYGGIAASFLVLLLGAWFVPGLLAPPEPAQPYAGLPGYGIEPEDAETPNMLYFNLTEGRQSSHADRGIDFIFDLDETELYAVFPDVEIPLWGRAFYLDGALVEVEATTLTFYGCDPDVPKDHPPFFRIRIGPGRLEDCVIWERARAPIVSDMYGVAVTVFVEHDSFTTVFLEAEFMLDDFLYRVELQGEDKIRAQTQMTTMVAQLIQGGTAGIHVLLDPDLPELRRESPSLEEARLDPDFGAFVPNNTPEELTFNFASRWVGQHDDYLLLEWEAPLDYDRFRAIYQRWATEHEGKPLWPFDQLFWQGGTVWWEISRVTEADLERIVSAGAPELYNWGLVPYVETMWQHYEPMITDTMFRPVFLAEELTLELVQARLHQRDLPRQIMCGSLTDEPFGYVPTDEMEFGVLFGDILVRVTTRDTSAEQLWAMFTGLDHIQD